MMTVSTSLIFRTIIWLAVTNGGGLFGTVSATICFPLTASYCPTTLFSTGTCDVDFTCACVTGYFPDDLGCRKELDVPVIELEDPIALPYGPEGSNYTLMCIPSDKGGMNYIWRLNGTALFGEIDATLLVIEPSMVSSPHGFTCQYSENGLVSVESDNFDINIVSLGDLTDTDPAIQPETVGFPATVVTGTQLTLICTNIMKFDRSFSWIPGLDSASFTDNELSGVVFAANLSTDNICEITYTEGLTTLVISAPNVVSSFLSDNIPGVNIAEGNRYAATGDTIILTCAFDEDDFVTDGVTIDWEWSFNGTTDGSLTTQAISLVSLDAATHHGEWICTAQFGSQPIRESPPIFVHVDLLMAVTITTAPAQPVTNGFLEVICNVESSLTAADFAYSWTKDTSPLTNYHDSTLFLSEVTMTDAGDYGCTATVDLISAAGTTAVNTPFMYSYAGTPTLSINNGGSEFVFTEVYLLTCATDPDYATPGVIVTFYESGSAIAESFNNTYVVAGNATDRVFSCEAEFDDYSAGESNTVDVSFAVFDAVQIEDTDGNVITTIDGIVNAQVTLVCEVSLLPGVVEDPVIGWFDIDLNQVGDAMILDLNVTQVGNATYFCVAQLGSHSQPSGNNITVTGLVFGTPVLTLLNGVDPDTSLDFSQIYFLHCEVGMGFESFELEYEFLRDGTIFEVDLNDTFTIPNDIEDRQYTCVVFFDPVESSPSNAIDITFEVFDTVQIEDTDGNVITTIDGIVNAQVTLVCQVSLLPLPGVDEDPVIGWFDLNLNKVGDAMIQDLNVTQAGDVTYFCVAELGSHRQSSANNITVTGHVFGTPVLTLLNGVDPDTSLDFSQSYFLHCEVDMFFSSFELEYEFLRDGTIFEDGLNDTFPIPNDVEDRQYTCVVLFDPAESPTSNAIDITFEVIDSVDILDTDNNVITTAHGIVDAFGTFVCDVNLVPEVTDEPSVTWFDDTMSEVGSDVSLHYTVPDEHVTTFFCVAEIGSHSMRSANNVTLLSQSFISPFLSLVGSLTTNNLDFQQSYQLHCDPGKSLTSVLTFGYTFSKDGTDDVINGTSANYTVQNDVFDRVYQCQAVYQLILSPDSNMRTLSFAVFQSLEILNTDGDILTTVNTIENTSFTLVASVSLLPGVPGNAAITWFDDAMVEQGTGSNLIVNTTTGLNASYFFVAELGSHTMNSPGVIITAHTLDAPVLNFTDSVDGDDLDFSQSYDLLCYLDIDFSHVALQYDFLRDGVVVQSSPNNSYTIYNDILDRQYTCQVLFGSLASPMSNVIDASFEVFEDIDIVGSLRCHVRSDVDPTFEAILTCNVLLQSGVPDMISYMWTEGSNSNVSSASTFSLIVTEDVNTTIACRAEIGSHVETFSLVYRVIASNITIPCSASCFQLSITLLGFVIASTYYCLSL